MAARVLTGRRPSGGAGVALVTGGGQGVGRAVAIGLATAGWDVAFSYRGNRREAARTAAEVRARGRRVMAERADVTRPAQVRRLFAAVRRALGAPQLLVNNVGEYTEGAIAAMSFEEWRSIFDSNLHATFLCTREALAAMRRAGNGRIINITASVAETMAPAPGAAAYHVAKQAVLAFTRALAAEEGAGGITVNAVGPGLTDNAHLGETWERTMRALTPAKRLVRPEEVARCVVFLADPGSRSINGAQLSVGGGWILTGGPHPDASLMGVLGKRRR